MTLNLSCSFADGSAGAWARELAVALPEVRVQGWQEGDPSADYAVVWKPTQGFLDSQTALKAIFNAGAGVDALTGLRLPKNVPVVRLENAGMAEQMCEYVLHAVLHHYREFDIYALQAAKGIWASRPPRRKAEYPVGVLGYGVLGRAVADALSSAGFEVVAWARTAGRHAPIRIYAGDEQLARFLRASRILVCLLPLTPATRNILNEDAFAAMQRGGYLINAARGGHVDINHLIEALNTEILEGATLDVFEQEPIPAGHPLWTHPKVRVTPHISAATLRHEAIVQIAAKLRAIERGECVTGVVDDSLGY